MQRVAPEGRPMERVMAPGSSAPLGLEKATRDRVHAGACASAALTV